MFKPAEPADPTFDRRQNPLPLRPLQAHHTLAATHPACPHPMPCLTPPHIHPPHPLPSHLLMSNWFDDIDPYAILNGWGGRAGVRMRWGSRAGQGTG